MAVSWDFQVILISFCAAIGAKASAYLRQLGKRLPTVVCQWMSMFYLTPFLRQVSSLSHIIFWGAPPHLIGIVGSVKIALPPLIYSLKIDVLYAV